MHFAITSRERDHCLCCWINNSCVVLYTFLKICISLILSSFYISYKACLWFCCAKVYHCWYPLSSCMHLIVVSYLSSSPDDQVLPYLTHNKYWPSLLSVYILLPMTKPYDTWHVCMSVLNKFVAIHRISFSLTSLTFKLTESCETFTLSDDGNSRSI